MTASTNNGRRSGGGQSSPPGLETIARLVSGDFPSELEAAGTLPPQTLRYLQAAQWPTPNARVSNDGEEVASWEARRLNLALKGINGNGAGTPLAIAAKIWPTPREGPTSSEIEGIDRRMAEMKEIYRAGGPGWGGIETLPTAAERLSRRMWPTMRSNESGNYQRDRTGAIMLTLSGAVANWSTPRASDGEKGGPNQQFGSNGTPPLPAQASSWQTPSAADTLGGHLSRGGDRSGELLLHGQEKAWATPKVTDWRSGEVSEEIWEKNSRPLTEQTARWPTPRLGPSADQLGDGTRYPNGRIEDRAARWHPSQLPQDPTTLQVGLATSSCSPASSPQLAVHRVLNPLFVEALLGWPINWTRVYDKAPPVSLAAPTSAQTRDSSTEWIAYAPAETALSLSVPLTLTSTSIAISTPTSVASELDLIPTLPNGLSDI